MAAGGLLVLGLLTPLAAAGVVGVMVVAWITNHAGNGFFIFNEGEGYEYVMTVTLVAIALAGTGPGAWSIDARIGLHLAGWTGLAIALGAGVGGALALLAVAWRRPGDGAG